MKKFLLLFLSTFSLVSCSVDDDSPQVTPVPAKVIATNLPAFFEEGETYDVEVTYLLPTECHIPIGLNVQRAAEMGNGRRDIFIWGVATSGVSTECNEDNELTNQEDENPLEQQANFSLKIDEDEPYTFYLWAGYDTEGQDVFTEVVVPVGVQEPEEQK